MAWQITSFSPSFFLFWQRLGLNLIPFKLFGNLASMTCLECRYAQIISHSKVPSWLLIACRMGSQFSSLAYSLQPSDLYYPCIVFQSFLYFPLHMFPVWSNFLLVHLPAWPNQISISITSITSVNPVPVFLYQSCSYKQNF